VTKRGYAHLVYGAHGSSRQGTALSLDPGQHLADITLRVSPQAVITGRVVDEDGDPAPNIELQLLRYSYRKGKRKLEPWENSSTNEPGRSTVCSDCRPEILSECHARRRSTTVHRQAGLCSTYYPGASDPASAGTLELQPGTLLRGVEITLVKNTHGAPARARGGPLGPCHYGRECDADAARPMLNSCLSAN